MPNGSASADAVLGLAFTQTWHQKIGRVENRCHVGVQQRTSSVVNISSVDLVSSTLSPLFSLKWDCLHARSLSAFHGIKEQWKKKKTSMKRLKSWTKIATEPDLVLTEYWRIIHNTTLWSNKWLNVIINATNICKFTDDFLKIFYILVRTFFLVYWSRKGRKL